MPARPWWRRRGPRGSGRSCSVRGPRSRTWAGRARGRPGRGPWRWRRRRDADLAVLGSARGAGVLALDASGDGALLDEAGVVGDQDAVGGAEAFGDVGLEVIADPVCVPAGSCEQALQPVRGRMACVLGQLPAVLAAYRAKEPVHAVPHPPPGFDPGRSGPRPVGAVRPVPGPTLPWADHRAHPWAVQWAAPVCAGALVRATCPPNHPRPRSGPATLTATRPLTRTYAELSLEY